MSGFTDIYTRYSNAGFTQEFHPTKQNLLGYEISFWKSIKDDNGEYVVNVDLWNIRSMVASYPQLYVTELSMTFEIFSTDPTAAKKEVKTYSVMVESPEQAEVEAKKMWRFLTNTTS